MVSGGQTHMTVLTGCVSNTWHSWSGEHTAGKLQGFWHVWLMHASWVGHSESFAHSGGGILDSVVIEAKL